MSLSSCEAEYIALTDAAKDAIHLRRVLSFIDNEFDLDVPTTIYEDNQAAQKIAENPVLHDRTKHIDIRYHFVRELVEQMKISIVYITTKQMVADLLTKAVSKLTFETLVGSLFGKEM